jgi:hypothetical protein
MFSLVAHFFMGILVLIALIRHFFRLLYLLFHLKVLERYKYFTRPPTRQELILYYVTVCFICVVILVDKIGRMYGSQIFN